jgi:DNA-binding PadR family transcriptional regulator
MAKTAAQYLPLTESAYLILASLTEPSHGYAIMQEAALVAGNGLKLGPGTLYTSLGKLIEQGLIRPAGESGQGGERRKLYRLTPLGRDVVVLECRRLEALVEWGRGRLEKSGGKL